MKKKILVVVDMQNDFITGPLGNAECVNVVKNVVDVIKNGDYDEIWYTQDTHGENYLETREGKNLQVVHCIHGTEGWQIESNVKQAIDKSKAIKKYFMKNTFGCIEMEYHIDQDCVRNDDNTQIDFCGVCTGICVISNVMIVKACLPEANIRVLADACACVTPESHKTALEAMKLCQVEVVE